MSLALRHRVGGLLALAGLLGALMGILALPIPARAAPPPGPQACTPISFPTINTGTTTQLITADTTGRFTIICGIFIWANGSTNVNFLYGTGGTCGTGTVNFMGNPTVPINMVAGSGFVYNGPAIIIPPTNNVCITNSGAVGITGTVTFFVTNP